MATSLSDQEGNVVSGIEAQTVEGLADIAIDPSVQRSNAYRVSRKPEAGHLQALAKLDLASGADNLLLGCIQAKPGERLLLLREDSCHGFYDCAAPAFVADYARFVGLDVIELEVDAPGEGRGLPDDVVEVMQHVDHALFFARIGDQLRFDVMPGHCSKTISYAFDVACLGSRFGTTPHGLMADMKAFIDCRIASSDEIRITCPLGTDLIGCPDGMTTDPIGSEVQVNRFPLTVFKPVPAQSFSGKVALSRWLVGSGAHYYQPYQARFEGTVFALLEQGRIIGYEGPADVVEMIRDHHKRVGDMFDIDPGLVHSWHAGLHPQTFYPLPAEHNLARWSALAFGSPRYLHFHVCGEEPPGEISWTVIDPTITLDGVPAWEKGRLVLAEISEAQAILERYPGADKIFSEPILDIGI